MITYAYGAYAKFCGKSSWFDGYFDTILQCLK